VKVKFQGGQIREIDIFLGSDEHKTLATSPAQVIAFAKASPGFEEDADGILSVPFSYVGPYLTSTTLESRE